MSEKKEIDNAGSLIQALGGARGLLDSGLPTLVFVITFTLTRELTLSLNAALILAGVLAVIRLIARDTLQHAISGLLGIGIAYLLARTTGEAKNFYLPGLFINAGYAVVYAIGNLLRWPIFGLLIGAIQGTGTSWRSDPAKVALYTKIGWLWAAMFAARIAVQYPLYASNSVDGLGYARVIMGWPLFLVVGYLTWLLLRRAGAVTKTAQ